MDSSKVKKSFVLFADSISSVRLLTDEQAGKLFKQILEYVNGMEVSLSQDPDIAIMFETFRTLIDREHEKWEEKCRKNKEASHKRKCYKKKASKDVATLPTSDDNHRQPPTSDDNLRQLPISDVILSDSDSDNDSDSDSDSDSEGLEANASLKPMVGERYPFDEIWRMYGKPYGNVSTLREKWKRLPETDKAAIFEYVPTYVASRPEVRYRKNFENFLSLRVWENEPLTNENHGNEASHQSDASRRQSAMQDAAGLMREYLEGDRQPDA